MTARTLLRAAAAAAITPACAAPAAHAATIAPDPTPGEGTALDGPAVRVRGPAPPGGGVARRGGPVVWVSGSPGAQRLMQQDASGTRPVQGAPAARAYR